MSRRFSPAVFYVLRRPLNEWLRFDDQRLAELVSHTYRRQTTSLFGSWRKKAPRATQVSSVESSTDRKE
jgi:hypothetical protein